MTDATQPVIGLTGGIAMGKTTACEIFASLGIDCIACDEISRQLLRPGEAVFNQVLKHFGVDFLDADGTLNRQLLRQHIMQHDAARQWLDQCMHPVIRSRVAQAVDSSTTPYCIVDIPLLKSKTHYPMVTRILVIDMPEPQQIKRLMARDQLSESAARHIINTQPSRENRLALADDVLDNQGNIHALRAKIIQLNDQYLKL